MHCVWSRWPAWSGSSCDRLQCTVPGSTKPYAEWHKPYVEWHKPCRYYRLLFLGKPRRRFPPPFSAAFRLSHHNSTGPSADGLCRRFPWVVFRQPSSQRRFCCWLPLLFPSADPSRLRRRPIGIFSGFLSAGLYQEPPPRFSPVPLWGNGGAMEAAPPEADPLLGRLCFLSVIDGVAPYQNLISDETAWIKAVSLVFLRSIAWHRAAAPRSVRFRLTICSRSLIHSDWLSR